MLKNAKVHTPIAIICLLALNLIFARVMAGVTDGVNYINGRIAPSAQTIPTRTPTSTLLAKNYLPLILKLETTPTPTSAFITLTPDCGFAPTVQVSVVGYNWPVDETISLFWDGALQSIISAGHPGFFQQTWTLSVSNKEYVVVAVSTSAADTKSFTVPCPGTTLTPVPTPTLVATPTAPPP